jgi:hypothetical protein
MWDFQSSSSSRSVQIGGISILLYALMVSNEEAKKAEVESGTVENFN